MDFQHARDVFENSLAELPQLAPSPVAMDVSQLQSPQNHILSSTSPSPPSPGPHQYIATTSISQQDVSASNFDTSPSSHPVVSSQIQVHHVDLPQNEKTPPLNEDPELSAVTAQRVSSVSQPWSDEASDSAPASDEEPIVRQASNFSQLSAQSWLTVDSAHYVTVSGKRSFSTGMFARQGMQVADHDPATLFDVDPEGMVMTNLLKRDVRKMTVLECCAVLQSGCKAVKKKAFRRFGERRIWLGEECDKLFWSSKKEGVFADYIKLSKVARVRCVEREVMVEGSEGYRMSLEFGKTREAQLWTRALSCLIPLQAVIRAPRGVVPRDKEREDYTLTDDVFESVPLREYMAVNSYVVLCAAKGVPLSVGNKLAFCRNDGSFCGVRYIPRRLLPVILRSQQEIAVLKRLDHPNIVKYHECLVDSERGGNYLVFEHAARGSLMDGMKLEGVKPVPEATARKYMRDVLRGLEYLHSLRISHGDIRPDTLLRGADGSIKINALGCITHDFTEVTSSTPVTKVRLGDASPAFLAPEQCWLSEGPKAKEKSYAMDVWAAVVMLYFMLYGRVPFGGTNDEEIQESICKGKLRFPRYPETSRKVRNLLKGVLGEKDPKTRIELKELMMHPWFTDHELEDGALSYGYGSARLIVSPEEIDSAVQTAKVGVTVGTGKKLWGM